MMHRLVHLPHIVWGEPRGHRFNALAFDRQQQSLAISLQWFTSVEVPCGLRQALNICRKAIFLGAWRSGFGAHVQQYRTKPVWFQAFYNTVVLACNSEIATSDL